jgi:cell division protein FtsB
MKRKDHTWYWLTLALVTVLALAYIDKRDLHGRYETYRETVRTVEEQRVRVESLREFVANERERVTGMDTDPLEQEANIRRANRLAREGEIIFRVEARP